MPRRSGADDQASGWGEVMADALVIVGLFIAVVAVVASLVAKDFPND